MSIGPWERGHLCNSYRRETSVLPPSTFCAESDRYMRSFDRCRAHYRSLEPEGELGRQFAQFKTRMKDQGVSLTDQQAVQEVFKVLRGCYRILTYTYPFTFYLDRTGQVDIFERNQDVLKTATEDLLERFKNKINGIEQLAGELMDKKSYCNDRRKALLDHCREGYEANYWTGLNES